MKKVTTECFRATADAVADKRALQEAFRRMHAAQDVSTTLSNLTISLLHDGGKDHGMVLVALTLSGVALNETHALKAHQALMRDIPGLTQKIASEALVTHLSLEFDVPVRPEHCALDEDC